MLLALAASLALLLAHAWHYAFLTDDAYISFRYARNLSEGAGLVFNPGQEAVEGYTNFLWVLLLAGLDRLGAPPHQTAIPLSLAFSVGLWALVAAGAARYAPAGRGGAAAAVATGLLAVTPSVAVWSTGGLETRLFELLVVAAVLRVLHEDAALARAAGDDERARVRPLAAGLFALATLTRPDAQLIAACVLGATVLLRLRELVPRWRWSVQSAAIYVGVVGAHYAFRRLYYGEWLPNTWYAKVSGQTWWELGGRYLETFALEHAVYLWLPLLAAGGVFQLRRGRALVPLVFAAACLPHALYVASVGGDHFEFRPVDLYFPFAFVLMAHGALALCRGRGRSAAVAVWLLLVAAAGLELPWRSHAEFPDRYIPSFPGGRENSPAADAYLAPEGARLYRLPGLAAVAARHRELVDVVTRHYAALRREEHALFLEQALAEGRALRRLVARGVLPVDTHIGVCCVGAIPYWSRLRTLDRIGLTDAVVARGEVTQPQLLAHARSAPREYGRERGVDFWSLDPVRLLFNGSDPRFAESLRGMHRMGYDAWVAPVGEGLWLVAELLQGIEATRRKFPNLDWRSLRDPAAVRRTLRELGADPRLDGPSAR
jgi:arabinofuranosyltransferase